ncbi:hypothetical protein L1987_80973 [Smallanthus sonchifolius]|uniref:Uncharacterized protein n=1 Tax=Smallanthus sonchifolius TaxID=185202 RepID=A0ACB8YQQ5_9ASTR|nr:hypothetical protein L1987_80973 [Smallanthus sonchifolius]
MFNNFNSDSRLGRGHIIPNRTEKADKLSTLLVTVEAIRQISGSPIFLIYHSPCKAMKFLDWYVKIAVVSAAIGGSMEYFMIKSGFYDKVTVLESEKRAWENSPEAQAMREALNPWRDTDANARKHS